ncbi:ribonuclease III [Actinomycetaceae bacterium TAE3-ERU4]|nr:ribonuclease III [Actinomycetaceae bacterium TAE3-ERU4]
MDKSEPIHLPFSTLPSGAGTKLLTAWGCLIDPELLILALTHRSFANENGGLAHNERLEFLGDSILSLIVSEYLFKNYPDRPESHLSKMRAGSVSQPALALVGRSLELGRYILLGKGERKSNGADKDSILSDAVEALIGATYLTSGLEVTRKVVLHQLKPLLSSALERGAATDPKTPLQEICADLGLPEPVYVISDSGPDHCKTYTAVVTVGEDTLGEGTGTSKRYAEREAAAQALAFLRAENKIEDKPILTGSGIHGETYPHLAPVLNNRSKSR